MTQIVNSSEVDFVYLTIPVEYVNVYRKLIKCLANINTYASSCNNKNLVKVIYEAWLMFQSAIASKKIQDEEKANTIITYIENILDKVFFIDNEGGSEDCICEIMDIDEEGILKVKSNCDCCVIPTFYIDPATGNLMSEYEYENLNN